MQLTPGMIVGKERSQTDLETLLNEGYFAKGNMRIRRDNEEGYCIRDVANTQGGSHVSLQRLIDDYPVNLDQWRWYPN